ncbi:MAG: STAS domain-containing protein [Gammaproteobacteria bacterium]|nr:STAS domain-containing protein [Gammaproteobacteria bacterium]
MFNIAINDEGVVAVEGRLDAAQAPRAQEFLDQVPDQCTIDMAALEYISSAGLGVLLRTHKRIMSGGQSLRLINVSKHINDIFSYSGFDRLFEIELADS